MNKSALSQLLDGAAFPAMVLAIAVSQIKIGPHRRDVLRQGKGAGVEFRGDVPVKQRAKEAQAH